MKTGGKKLRGNKTFALPGDILEAMDALKKSPGVQWTKELRNLVRALAKKHGYKGHIEDEPKEE